MRASSASRPSRRSPIVSSAHQAAAEAFVHAVADGPVTWVADPIILGARIPGRDRGPLPRGTVAMARVGQQVCPRCLSGLVVQVTTHPTTVCPACGWQLSAFLAALTAARQADADATGWRGRLRRARTTLALTLVWSGIAASAMWPLALLWLWAR